MIAAALLVPASRVLVRDVGMNWTRAGFLRIVQRMGAAVAGELEPVPPAGAAVPAGEPICDLELSASAPLRGTVVEAAEVPLAIDELPLVALLGCFAEGETVVRGAQELRLKESDRIAGVVDGLRGLGASIEATEDGFVVTGAAGCAAARSTRMAITAWRCSAPSRDSRRATASRSSGWTPPRSPTRASKPTSPRWRRRGSAAGPGPRGPPAGRHPRGAARPGAIVADLPRRLAALSARRSPARCARRPQRPLEPRAVALHRVGELNKTSVQPPSRFMSLRIFQCREVCIASIGLALGGRVAALARGVPAREPGAADGAADLRAELVAVLSSPLVLERERSKPGGCGMSASISRTARRRLADFTTLAGIADSHASTSTRFSEPRSRSNAPRSSATARNSSTRAVLGPDRGEVLDAAELLVLGDLRRSPEHGRGGRRARRRARGRSATPASRRGASSGRPRGRCARRGR